MKRASLLLIVLTCLGLFGAANVIAANCSDIAVNCIHGNRRNPTSKPTRNAYLHPY